VVPASALPKGNPSIAEAEECWREGNMPCAEADYMAYLAKYPKDQRANASLAIVLSEDGRHKEALPWYAKAESLGADTYDFHAGHARSLDATGDLDGAIKANYRALALVPSLVDVRGALADQLVRKGRTDEAVNLLETFDRSLEDRGHPPYFTQQIACIRAGRNGKAAAEAASAEAAGHLAASDAAAPGKGETLVPLTRDNGVLYVPVLLNGAVEADFTVDSGASDVVLSEDVFRELLRQKKIARSDYLGEGYGTLADGSQVSAELYNLRSLKVGDRTLHNVTAAVSRGRRGQLLLGQSFLRRFKSWSIDNKAKVLVLKD
jgi:clan AA aspartic protease (TIGR02281 family)